MTRVFPNSDRLIKLLIVDDEPVICEGLRYTIDWEELGVEVAGVAYDGEEALRFIENEEVNIVLTDIRMDGMDGLKLTEHLNISFPQIRVIIISGYEDFSYARQAIRMNVNDYLLKPVEIDELIKAIGKVIVGIKKEEASSDSVSANEDEQWLSNRIRNSPSYIKETVPAHLPISRYRMIATQLEHFSEWRSTVAPEQYALIQQQWIKSINDYLEAYSIRSISVFDHENLLYTLTITNIELGHEEWNDALEGLLESWRGEAPLYCGVSRVYDSLADTSIHCAEVTELLQYHVLEGNVILQAETLEQMVANRTLPDIDGAKSVQLFVPAMFKQDLDEVKTLVADLFQTFREHGFLLEEVVKQYDDISVLLRQRLRQSGLSLLEHSRKEPIDLMANNSYDSLQRIVEEEMGYLLLLIDKNGIDKSYWIIEKVKKYMAEHYRTDLKAFEVAAWLKITPSYFSLIFKQGTGKTFSEYMNELRIDHAKHLLASTHDKVFEISDQVGYKEYKYFVTVFKTYTGMTPKEYRVLNASR
ncbi:response regulator transcription factor [Cohnella abietis]|uniref:AraC family transcriptional regulator n=1 Tax=Cohnella abietis TaxID=2507935 RepID=A0A3T1D6Q6_9BACL|nr:response regulator [Cohnella abietis]BBI33766.1 AraC family transcriptional regulator [Cohnella abietis]